MVTVMSLQIADRTRWDILARGDKTCYATLFGDEQSTKQRC